MLPSQMNDLVAFMAQADPRIAPADPDGFNAAVAVWFATVGDLDAGDAMEVAVAHYSTALASDTRLAPGDLRAGVNDLRGKRLASVSLDDLMGDVPPDHPHYDTIWRQRREALMARPTAPTPPPQRALPSA
jgi:hypothetical protein